MPAWRLAPALVALRDEADELAPNRSRESDGTIGDPSHAARSSDHNPDRDGWVDALDLTHDPAGGFDAHAWADHIAARGDHRVSYLISRGRIHNPGRDKPGRWRPYPGANRHDKHLHVSVLDAHRHDTRPWLTGTPSPPPNPEPGPQVDPQEITMFIALDNGKRFAQVGSVIVGLSEADYQRCYAVSRGVPVMALPAAEGELAINAANAAARATATGKAQPWPFKK